jgi:hypothetical protein
MMPANTRRERKGNVSTGAALISSCPIGPQNHFEGRHSMTDPDAAVVAESDISRRRRTRVLRFIPGFTYIFILFVVGQFVFADPRAANFEFAGYRLAWVEVLMVAAAIVAMYEQIKIADPGVNNITEVLLMGVMAVIQVVLFALAAAKVPGLEMFNNMEFLLLTIINVAQTAVAFQINAATLMRTIAH